MFLCTVFVEKGFKKINNDILLLPIEIFHSEIKNIIH
jgi:hypothetical protein